MRLSATSQKTLSTTPLTLTIAMTQPSTQIKLQTRAAHTTLFGMLLAMATISLSNCSFFEPHKISIQQGNLVSARALQQLEVGMSKEQVRYLMGTPLSVDTFDPDYWLYSYTLRRDTEVLGKNHVKLRFEDDQLATIETEGFDRFADSGDSGDKTEAETQADSAGE